MGWSYPDISLDDLMRVIKGFIDMLVLASGYQSSGRLSHWDSHNIKNAFKWATFLQNVARCLRSSDELQDCVTELDATLSQLTADPYFPQGLRQISSRTLCHAGDLVLKHLLHTLPLRDPHLRASVGAIIEVDSHQFQSISSDELRLYLEKLMNDASENSILTGNPSFAHLASQSSICTSSLGGTFTKSAVQELGRRQMEASCISASETVLDSLADVIRKSNAVHGRETTMSKEQHRQQPPQRLINFMAEERPVEPVIWSRWKSRCLSYLLNKRTIRLVSGASLLFSAPKHQWIQVIGRMAVLSDTDEFYEKIELLMLGSIAHKWSSLVEKFMSSSYQCCTISKLFQEVQNFLSGRLHNLCREEDILIEENGALKYLEGLLSNQFHHLWKMSPVLPAMAIPSRSMLFRLYIIELERQVKGDSSAIRCCSCMMDGKNHMECEVAERIWCLYIFHVSSTWYSVQGVSRLLTSMKLSDVLSLIKIQISKWGRRIVGSGSAVILESVQRRISAVNKCCGGGGSYVAKQLVWRLKKSQWQPSLSLGWQNNNIRYNYDVCSYSQNFDDGCCASDHRSPLAP